MHFARSFVVCALGMLVVVGCIEGIGSGLTGVSGGGGGGTTTRPRFLTFFVQPNGADVGDVLSPPVQVVATDSIGTLDATFTAGVTLTLTSNATGASLQGTRTTAAARGIATFGNLRIDRPGVYTLRATATGATEATSSPFTITTATEP